MIVEVNEGNDMLFEIGDIVTVREDLAELGEDGYWDGGVGYDRAMSKYAGQKVTIAKQHGGLYRIKEDNGDWWWVSSMFENHALRAAEEVRPVVEHNAIKAIDKADIMKNLYATLELCEIYHPTDIGLNAVYNKWAKEKGESDVWEGNSVLDIISKHPDYVPGKGYIVKKNEFDRGVDVSVILDVLQTISRVLANPFTYNLMTEIKMTPFNYFETANAYYMYQHIYETLNSDSRFSFMGMTLENIKVEYDKWRRKKDEIETQYIIDNDKCYEKEEREKMRTLRQLFDRINNWVRSAFAVMTEKELQEPILIDDEVVRYIEETELNIRGIRAGQKLNKVVVKILTETGIKDKWRDYNKETARLGDAASPTKFTRFTIISANPLDYYRMSFGSSWSSCQTIDKEGHYRPSDGGDSYEGMHGSGTSSYMGDSSTLVMYTVDKNYDGFDYEMQPKINRCLFHLGEGKFVMGRVYPQGTDGESEVYRQWRQIFQQIISECMGLPNYWKTNKDRDEKSRQYTSSGTHYRDYECGYCDIAGWSYIMPTTDTKPSQRRIKIGSTPICPSCGREHWVDDNIECDNCNSNGMHECYGCGEYHNEDNMHYIDGEWYCEDCCFYCEYHNEWEIGESQYIENYGNVCEYALDSGNFRECDQCGYIYYVDGEDDSIDTEDGNWFCCYNCAKHAGYVECVDGCWYPEDETHYCSECDEYVHDSDWNEDADMCNSCAENAAENNDEEVA